MGNGLSDLQRTIRQEEALSGAYNALDAQYEKGLRRYGKTIAECDLSVRELMEMAQEELADGLIYISEALKRMKQEGN